MKCASCVNISICSDMKDKLPDECEYYQEKYNRNKKPEKLREPRKKAAKNMTINQIVAECKKISMTYGQFQALRREQEK